MVAVGGGLVAPTMLAVEERFDAAVLTALALMFFRAQPEVDQINFISRVTLPVLMLNGRYDVFLPVETSQIPFFELLGTPPEHKRQFFYESGHRVPRAQLIKEILDWLDLYLGPVS